MKKTLALLLTLAVVASLAGTATAGKKAKGPKPYKSEEVTIQLGHSTLFATSGEMISITGQEFRNTCTIPMTNGVDAYVWAVPDAYKNVDALISSFGAGGAAGYDLDIMLYDESCELAMASMTENPDETTFMAKGTAAYILIYNFGTSSAPIGGSDAITARFELKPHSL